MILNKYCSKVFSGKIFKIQSPQLSRHVVLLHETENESNYIKHYISRSKQLKIKTQNNNNDLNEQEIGCMAEIASTPTASHMKWNVAASSGAVNNV